VLPLVTRYSRHGAVVAALLWCKLGLVHKALVLVLATLSYRCWSTSQPAAAAAAIKEMKERAKAVGRTARRMTLGGSFLSADAK